MMSSAADCLLKRLVPFTVATMFVPLPLLAAEIQVPLDNVVTITLDRPAKAVYVGNPAIAGIEVLDSRHIFVLGKSYGTTNVVTLDASGHETINDQVIVTDRPGSDVTVQRGIVRTTMMCTPLHCQAAPAPGDDATDTKQQNTASPTFGGLTDEAAKHTDSGVKSADSDSKSTTAPPAGAGN